VNAVARFARRLIPKSFLAPVGSTGWWPRSIESFPGAWQQNTVVDRFSAGSYWAVFACITLIAKDISKMRPRVMQRDRAAGIFSVTEMRPVLNKPNHYQTRVEFLFSWIICQMLYGNTYVLKRRDERGFVDALYILDPNRVMPLVSTDGSVYYQLHADNLANMQEGIVVPASEIIHDRMYTLHHPLVGVSPIYACGIAAVQGLAIQDNSAKFFQNMSRPSGVLTAPGAISDVTATRLKTLWEENYSGNNIGRVGVLGDGLKYEGMTITATDSQLIEQLKMTGEMIAACFHVPGYKIGVGAMPTVSNTAALNQQYYDQCLQYIIEKLELRLDEGLEIEPPFETWLDLSGLLRMDPEARYKSHNEAINGGWKSPNEARREEDLKPVAGGDTPYMQQQNYSLAALNDRDRKSSQQDLSNQVAALQSLMTAGATAALPIESIAAAMRVAFPFLTDAQVSAIVNPLKPVEPPQPQTPDEGTMEQALSFLRTEIRGSNHARY